jgi:hypothetical protein
MRATSDVRGMHIDGRLLHCVAYGRGTHGPDGDCSNLKQKERGRDASKPREGTFHATVFD